MRHIGWVGALMFSISMWLLLSEPLRDVGGVFLAAGCLLLAFSVLDWSYGRPTDVYWTDKHDRARSDWWRD